MHRRRNRFTFASVFVACTFAFGIVLPGVGDAVAASSAVRLSIKVEGNQLVDGTGKAVQLRGVNRSGTEYACAQGWGIFDGPSGAASVEAIASWHTNAVRVPLNEDCWLGINGVNPEYGGANYQQAVVNYVKLLNSHHLYAILDLALTAPGTTLAIGPEEQMPDQDHSPAFWKSVAHTFKRNPATIFDLFSEPYPDNNSDTPAAWSCWENGGTCPQLSFQAAGMQELVDTVRATGATNVIMLGGIGYASVLDEWAAYAPSDSDSQLAASFHDYNFGGCTTVDCWNSTLADVGDVPLITGELGLTAPYIKSYMQWADPLKVSYLAWTWDTWGCDNEALISSYNGTPCAPYGSAYKRHLQKI